MAGTVDYHHKTYRDVLKHFGIYGLGQVAFSLASFLLLPLYTSKLSRADYGCVAILDMFSAMLNVIVGAGMAAAVSRHHHEAKTEADRDSVWWTGITLTVALATLLIGPAFLYRDGLAPLLLGGEVRDAGYFLGISLSALWCNAVVQLPTIYIRVRKWSTLSVTLSLSRLTCNIGLNLFFLIVQERGVDGVLWGNFLTAAIFAAIPCLFLVHDRGRYRFSFTILSSLVRFGLPLIVISLLLTLMQRFDLILLNLYRNISDVGLYALAVQIGMAINTLVQLPFGMIWSTVTYEIADKPQAKYIYVKVFEYFVYGLLLLMLGVCLFIQPLLSVWVSPKFLAATNIIPIICLANLFYSLHEHFRVPALLAKKTSLSLPPFVLATLVNVLCNLNLIPTWGSLGAAWVSVLTFVIFSFTGLYLYRKVDRYDYPLGRCGLVLAGMVLTFVGVRWLSNLELGHVVTLGAASLAWLTWAVFLAQEPLRYLRKNWRPFQRTPRQEIDNVAL